MVKDGQDAHQPDQDEVGECSGTHYSLELIRDRDRLGDPVYYVTN
jgi:hypothetical protein